MSHPAEEPGHKPSALFCGAVDGSRHQVQSLCVISWSCRLVHPSGTKPLRYFVALSLGPAIGYKASALFSRPIGARYSAAEPGTDLLLHFADV